MEELTNVHYVAMWGFGIAAVFGFVANKTHFCSMGGISDALFMGSKGRLGAWFLAIGIAVIGTQALQFTGVVDLSGSLYLGPTFNWLSHIVGGLLFGVGMTLGAGCGQRNLVRVGGGNLKSLVVLIVLGITAYSTVRGLLGLVRQDVLETVSVDLSAHGHETQQIPALLAGVLGMDDATWLTIGIGAVVGLGFMVFALRQASLRESFDNLLAGIVIGLCIVAGWFVTGHLGYDDFDPVPVESFTFIAPTGNTISYFMTFTGATINFGIALVFGCIVGSFIYAVASRNFRIETFSNRSEMVTHLVAGVLMGFGGVLALGCTIGQGVAGLSTLSLGSVLALLSIILGSVVTMKVEYHMLDEHGFAKALGLSLVEVMTPWRSTEEG